LLQLKPAALLIETPAKRTSGILPRDIGSLNDVVHRPYLAFPFSELVELRERRRRAIGHRLAGCHSTGPPPTSHETQPYALSCPDWQRGLLNSLLDTEYMDDWDYRMMQLLFHVVRHRGSTDTVADFIVSNHLASAWIFGASFYLLWIFDDDRRLWRDAIVSNCRRLHDRGPDQHGRSSMDRLARSGA
jgi:hypothetical protein